MSIDTLKQKDGTYRRADYGTISRAIDAGHTEHLQTEHGIVAIRPYKIDEVRVNKRTGEPQFPGEAVGKNVLIEFYRPGHKHGDEEQVRGPISGLYITDLIAWVFERLNGSMDTFYEAGDNIDVWANQAEREGCVLATIGDEVLLEYEMPGTTSQYGYNRRTGRYAHPAQPTSSLRIITTIGLETVGGWKAVSYNRVPKRWLAAIRDAGMTDWIGMGQRSTVRIPFPEQVTP